MHASGASFIARGYSNRMDQLKGLFKEAILHKGFSLVDVLQVCVTYYDMYDYYNKRVYELTNHDPLNYDQASSKIREWDYNGDSPIALGIFYRKQAMAATFEDSFLSGADEVAGNRIAKINRIFET